MTQEQYLEIERKAEYKSEYFDGEMFAMQRSNQNHNLINTNLIATLHSQLRKRGCFILASKMRVRVSSTGFYTYPDAVVECGPPQLLDSHNDTLLNPCFIIEVLSPATEAYDRGRKFEHYRKLDSLRQYLLIGQDRRHVDLYTRQQDGSWVLTEAGGEEDILELFSIDCRIAMTEIYEDVEFPPVA
jgi:Uma2 family endonuclease